MKMEGVDSMDDLHKIYNDYVSAFAIIPKEEKRKEIVDKIKNISMIMEDLSRKAGIPSETLFSTDIDRLEESSLEDDYLKAVFSHLVTLEGLLGNYLDKTIDI